MKNLSAQRNELFWAIFFSGARFPSLRQLRDEGDAVVQPPGNSLQPRHWVGCRPTSDTASLPHQGLMRCLSPLHSHPLQHEGLAPSRLFVLKVIFKGCRGQKRFFSISISENYYFKRITVIRSIIN